MAKDKGDKEKKKEKKDKKRSDTDGVHKKSKKDKKGSTLLNGAIEKELTADAPAQSQEAAVMDIQMDTESKLQPRPLGALVPFANPLAEEKVAKKVLKNVKKGMLFIHSSIHSSFFPQSNTIFRC